MIKGLRRRKALSNSPSSTPQGKAAEDKRRGLPKSKQSEPQQSPPAELPQPPTPMLPVDAVQKEAPKQSPFSERKTVERKLPSPSVEAVINPRDTPRRQGQVEQQSPAQNELRAAVKPDTRLGPVNQSPLRQSPTHLQQESSLNLLRASHDESVNMLPPALSTETTCNTTISTIPSAQVTTTQRVLPPQASLPSTGDQLLEDEQDHIHQDGENSFYQSTQAAIAAAHLQMQKELATPQATVVPATRTTIMKAPVTTSKSKSGITPFSVFNKPDLVSSKQNYTDTQEVLDAVTPFDLTTTIKKVPLTIPSDLESPTITGNEPTTKKPKDRKRASFASQARGSTGSNSGSSQGSIKASLKVTKNAADGTVSAKGGNHLLPESYVPSEFGKLGLDMETSCEDDQEEARNSARGADDLCKAPISYSATNGSFKTTGQDAQKITPRPALNHILQQDRYHAAGKMGNPHMGKEDSYGLKDTGNSEDFDLSAAMDEVGSFLQSWDMEKEVRELKKENMRPVRSGLRRSSLRKR